jgi:hypothetical protein
MEPETRKALLRELDAGIKRADAEAKKLREFREWVVGTENGASESVATINDEPERRVVKRPKVTLPDYIYRAVARIGPGPHSVPVLVKEAVAEGWATESEHKPQIMRGTLARLVNNGEVEPVGKEFRFLHQRTGAPAERLALDEGSG